MLIDSALVSGSKLKSAVKGGLGAVKKADRKLIARDQHRRVGDSLDLDAAMRPEMPQSPRWDYALSVPDVSKIIGREPHPAKDAEISVVIRKRRSALDYLRGHLRPGQHIAAWLWVTRGKVGFGKMEKARRILDQNGITFVGREVRSLG